MIFGDRQQSPRSVAIQRLLPCPQIATREPLKDASPACRAVGVGIKLESQIFMIKMALLRHAGQFHQLMNKKAKESTFQWAHK